MRIDEQKCVNCGQCVPYCPMGCIREGDGSMRIDGEDCVECGICLRNADCPVEAIEQEFLQMPRAVRRAFSDPFGKHENTELKHMGRGTEEIKTNDVTGVIHTMDRVAVAVELGRPLVGARFRDAEAIAKAVCRFDVEFEKNNPVTSFLVDPRTGEMEPSILDEKVLSCIVEFKAETTALSAILAALREVEREVQTVFTVGVICRIGEGNQSPVEQLLKSEGYPIYETSSKTNVGLGRPKYEDRVAGGRQP